MAGAAFGALAAAKRLREAGAPATAVNDALSGNLATLAPKADLESDLAVLEERL